MATKKRALAEIPEGSAHDACRARAAALQEQIDLLTQKLASFTRQTLGPKTEKMPAMEREVQKERPRTAEERDRMRKQNQLARKHLKTEVVDAPVPEGERDCPTCKCALHEVGNGTPSVMYHYVAAHLRRIVYRRETLACPACREHIVTAPVPDKAFERSAYSPEFVAHMIVQKVEDGIPIYRLEKQFERVGIPVARSTMSELFHRAAEVLAPIANRILHHIRESHVVFADETSLKMQTSEKRAFVWTFLSQSLTGFIFSPSRSGETPSDFLGTSKGILVVDLYSGYNHITALGHRIRAGCWAHARRKIFEAKDNPEALEALELIRDMYLVEHDVARANLVGQSEHLAIRKHKARPIVARLLLWARRERKRHGPKSLLGRATGYILRNRKALTRFLYFAEIPPDNNQSESALRRVALGRKNYLFVHDEDSGKNHAGLFSIVASCIQNRKNPADYIADMLRRVHSTRAKDIDTLLPDRWLPTANQPPLPQNHPSIQ